MPHELSHENQLALASAPKPGTVFAEKYVIESVLGVGGMGYVLRARHLQLDEKVAIKMLLPKLAGHAETVARFLREGRAAVKIRSEHVGRVLDVGSTDGTHFIIMEYLDGTDLAGLLAKEKRLSVPRAVDYLLQACEALAEAHALRIVHRDLKPANLFLIKSPNGQDCVKVLDFGISKMTAPEGSPEMEMTKTSSVMGSPLYMSPEQLVSAKNVDGRSDIWALGVILFELLAGRPPFLPASLPELGAMVLSGRAPDVRKYAPDVPPALAAVISVCLKTKAEDRFPSVAELAMALAPYGSDEAQVSSNRISAVMESVPRPDTSGAWKAVSAGPVSRPRASARIPMSPRPVTTGNTWGSATEPEQQVTDRGMSKDGPARGWSVLETVGFPTIAIVVTLVLAASFGGRALLSRVAGASSALLSPSASMSASAPAAANVSPVPVLDAGAPAIKAAP